ncbi:FecR family protein [Parapedobacter koreensis]|uniref:FecR family protein n=1 Tax=Parapedobacter koreensis TaxID=332977 RepID=A0A1H7FQQ4_9SPHI|nr:FecR domain-containing protein [Parapedobacter koreensis]SEK26802.1 FecR family protein [Parapedobacter koreensis]
MRPHLFKGLLRKYRAGKTTEQETKLVDDWYASFGEVFPEKNAQQQKALRNELHARIQRRLSPDEMQPAGSGRRYLLRGMAAAAVVMMAIGIGAWYLAQRDGTSRSQKDRQWVAVTAEQGTLKKVQLPDSTTVWLNAGSKLGFYTPFGQAGSREVVLEEGEAFFEVTPDTAKPFIVHSDVLSTRVLGTSFNVKAYAELNEMQVSVLTGRVEVSQGDSLVLGVLHRGDELTYRKSTQTASIQQVATENSNGWMVGKTSLRQASFDELAVVLRHSHGMRLRAGDGTIAKQRYSIQFSRDVPIDDLIKAICEVHGNQYRKEGDTITIF